MRRPCELAVDQSLVGPGTWEHDHALISREGNGEIHLIDGERFLLESHLDVLAGHMHGFLGRVPG
ncbi:hypothetical protein ACFYOC_08050 [Nocardiopsis alba]|uniref:hypothetical protein n=1 Tax=Nocardiopsis alba TaxID=53437 RepID=UPI0036BB71AB